MNQRINRNILECKDTLSAGNQERLQRINRNILECKVGSKAIAFVGTSVLIETYWNVKNLQPLSGPSGRSINRNILECKDVSENREVII